MTLGASSWLHTGADRRSNNQRRAPAYQQYVCFKCIKEYIQDSLKDWPRLFHVQYTHISLRKTLREDTHNFFFFSGRTTKGEGRETPPPLTTKQKPIFFLIRQF